MILILLVTVISAKILLNQHKISSITKSEQLKTLFSTSPTIGNKSAKNHIYLFEDLACPGCQYFHKAILPQIKTQLIDTNKAQFTTVLVQLHPKTGEAITVSQCLSRQNTSFFTTFTDKIYARKDLEESSFDNPISWVTKNTAKYDGLNQEELKKCVTQDNMKKFGSMNFASMITLSKQHHWYKVSGNIATPTILVNGKRIENYSFENIKAALKKT